PETISFAERNHTGLTEPLLGPIARGSLLFSRDLWRLLVGEVLYYGAADIPDLPTAPDTLRCLLNPERYQDNVPPRPPFAWIEQVQFGCRDLVFGSGFYRPEYAGYNATHDVERLASQLATIHPDLWTRDALTALPEVVDDEDRAEELEYARACVAGLQ